MMYAVIASMLINQEIVCSITPSKDSTAVIVTLKNTGIATKNVYSPSWSVVEVTVISWPPGQSLKTVRGFGKAFAMYSITQLKPGCSKTFELPALNRFRSYKPGNYSLLLMYTDEVVNGAAEKFSWKVKSEAGVLAPVAINLNISKKGTYKFEFPNTKKAKQ